MSKKFRCTVPVAKPDGSFIDSDGTYFTCDEPAKYQVGFWYVCEKHKKYYTDPNKWPAVPLKGENNDKEFRS